MTKDFYIYITKTTTALVFSTIFTLPSWANDLPSPEEPANAVQTTQTVSTQEPSTELSAAKEFTQKLLSMPVNTLNTAIESISTHFPASLSLEIKQLPEEKQKLWFFLFSFRVMTEAPAPSKLPDLNNLLKRQQSIIDAANHVNTSNKLYLALLGTSSLAFATSAWSVLKTQLTLNTPTLAALWSGLSWGIAMLFLVNETHSQDRSKVNALLSDYTKDINKLFREMTQIIQDKESKLKDTYALSIAPSVLQFVQNNSIETLHQELELMVEKMQKQYFSK
jgi:hypothetical protein